MSRRTVSLVAFVLVLGACGSTQAESNTTTISPVSTIPPTSTTSAPTAPPQTEAVPVVPQSYAEFRDQPTACDSEQPEEATEMTFDTPQDMGADASVTVIIQTSCGPITLELDAAAAPETVNSFLFLAEQGFFDGTVSHRVLPGFIIQAGDPTATGFGGPGYAVPDEFPPGDFTYTRGTLAMANAGPGTSGSQFFIVLDDVGLPPQYSVFGTVVDGFDVLDAIATVELGAAPGSRDPSPSTPLQTIYLEAVEVDK